MIITNSLKLAILSKFETQGDFAQAIGIHESTVSRVLRRRKKLTGKEAEKWSIALECDPAVLSKLTEKGDESDNESESILIKPDNVT